MKQVRRGLLALCMLSSCVDAELVQNEPEVDSGDELEAVDPTRDEQLLGWEEDPFDGSDENLAAITCDSRWTLPAESAAATAEQFVYYDGSGRSCSGGPTEGATALGRFVRTHFGGLMNLDVPGDGVQIYACRAVRGGSGMSLHAEGRAVDIFIPTRGGAADNARGDTIANWLAENAEYIGVQMIIWDRTIWRTSRTPHSRCYGGSHPHNDHIHVELTREGAAGDTDFFMDLWAGRAAIPEGADGLSAWIGSPCRTDPECDFVHSGLLGRCYLEHAPAGGQGFCTLPCEGLCPDRGGFSQTFCADLSDLGAPRSGGTCAVIPGPENDRCRAGGLVPVLVNRYVGDSGAAAAQGHVCGPDLTSDPVTSEPDSSEPEESSGAPRGTDDGGSGADSGTADTPADSGSDDTPPDSGSDDTPPDSGSDDPPADSGSDDPPPDDGRADTDTGNGGICLDESLPLSEHDLPCAGFSENYWRCACSNSHGTSVSQVCRSGNWINYQLDPVDCGRCEGSYTSGCEAGAAGSGSGSGGTDSGGSGSGNGGVCTDASLPLSDHGRDCSEFPENHWRCACSEGYGVSVSQVCRSGNWINYHTNPANCATCDGSYSSGCE